MSLRAWVRRRLTPLLAALAVLTSLAGALAPMAGATTVPRINFVPPIVGLSSPTERPPGFTIDGAQALAVAKTSPAAIAVHRRLHPLQLSARVWLGSRYEVYMFFRGNAVADVEISATGRILATWTGPLIEATYGRGNYAPVFDSPWVCLPFGVLFLIPFLRLRRRPSLVQADLLMLVGGFGLSYWLFNQLHFTAAVWVAYLPLVYLLVRLLTRGFRPARPRAGLDSWMSPRLLLAGLVVLIGARIGLTVTQGQPIDVGLASVAGGWRILHGLPIYYADPGHPDTYGPINYLLYAPFDLIFGWSGKWDALPAAKAAALTFDLVTIGGLFWLGRRLRTGIEGRRLGLMLAWLWAACPFTLLCTMRGTNDEMVSALLVGALLCLTSPAGRGAILGLGAAAKFVPGLLLPLAAVGPLADRRSMRVTVAGFVIVVGASFALFLPSGGIAEVWRHTLQFQFTRNDRFSVWGLHPSLSPIKDVLALGVVGLAGLVALRPRGVRSLPQVGALMAAVLIAAQLPAQHWFYYYIAWFLPGLLVALAGPESFPAEQPSVDEPRLQALPVPVPAAVDASDAGVLV